MNEKALVEVGKTYRIDFGKDDPNNIAKLYILAIVDGHMVVCKHWLKHRRTYTYYVRNMDYFVELFKKMRLR